MNIAGLVRSSLIDFPGLVSAVIFTPGCNFRCPWCHNAELARAPVDPPPTCPMDSVLAFLESRRGKLGGVVISGGEPTLQAALEGFCATLRSMDFAVKLDTNGTNPDLLDRLLDRGLVTSVAMDVKGPPEHYVAMTGIPKVPLDRIERSMAILKDRATGPVGSIQAEFRTTIMEPMFDEQCLLGMADWIPKGIRWRLQGFTAQHGMLEPLFAGQEPTAERLAGLQALVDAARSSR
ncbi:MAG TPA: anaerobic ribonucleoside-triphosphate reductase activating protein [Spirochaetota bacterium]|nr:anaerobic ribonucleoside-triphosphate reductase activating protein [Spirochaetota bacterium]HPN82165.1 anaerobic ribonucleoside-triphosphate reductase activating protein [Spirochaetota bacterium]